MYKDFDAFCDFLDDELPLFDSTERSAMWTAVCEVVEGFQPDAPATGNDDPSLWLHAALWASESRATQKQRDRLRRLVITLSPEVLATVEDAPIRRDSPAMVLR
jgi:hypothetical protein